MLRALAARFRQHHRTVSLPFTPASFSDRFRGLPIIKDTMCEADCHKCQEICPTAAVTNENKSLVLDLGKCLFCGECENVCPSKNMHFTTECKLGATTRQDLIITPGHAMPNVSPLSDPGKKILRKSLKLRQVSAGGCNACEADVNVLNTIVFDLGRFGVQFVASPRHADGLLITGPVTQNMKLALQKTYDAIAEPKLVIALGACAISGGPFRDHPEVNNGVNDLFPVDLYIPGCPPHPATTLTAILDMLAKKS